MNNRFKFGVALLGMALVCFGLMDHVAAGATFTTIDHPGQSGNVALDINEDQIVG
jgi:hypothetical protein